jgi:three-Cys-motif partner protein
LLHNAFAMVEDAVTWEREDHTKAKHDLLVAFFNKWVSIHSGYYTQQGGGLVRIYDGFAGPGVYTGGEPGSPRILLEALVSHPHLLDRWQPVRYEFTFVERDPARATMLQSGLADFEQMARTDGRWTDRIVWSVTCGSYEEHVPSQVNEPSALFLFLDPFGYRHAPMTLTGRLVQQPKSDTLIFLPLSFVHRFSSREGQEEAQDRFFGTSAWRNIKNGPERPAAMLSLFRAQLRAAGLRYTLPFRLMSAGSNNEYWIVGASGHPAGFESVKEAFWTVDPVNGQGFVPRRKAAVGQVAFDFEDVERPTAGPNTEPLLELLHVEFGMKSFSVEDAIAFTETTRFLRTHLKQRTLAPAEQAGALLVERPPGARQFVEGRGISMRFAFASDL